jgi:hypothetical protein
MTFEDLPPEIRRAIEEALQEKFHQDLARIGGSIPAQSIIRSGSGALKNGTWPRHSTAARQAIAI